jgi:hypothetical protein
MVYSAMQTDNGRRMECRRENPSGGALFRDRQDAGQKTRRRLTRNKRANALVLAIRRRGVETDCHVPNEEALEIAEKWEREPRGQEETRGQTDSL